MKTKKYKQDAFKSEEGFSLVELIVSMAISSFIIVSTAFMLQAFISLKTNESSSDKQLDLTSTTPPFYSIQTRNG